MIIYSHQDCLLKFNGNGHPERKERLKTIIKSIESSELNVEFKDAPLADLKNKGVPPTERKALTGEFTPPGINN